MFRTPISGYLAPVKPSDPTPPGDYVGESCSDSRICPASVDRPKERFERSGCSSSPSEHQRFDGEVMEGIARRDPTAMRMVVDVHGSSVLRSAVYKLGDPHLAEDVMQSVLIGIWQSPEKFDSRRGSLRSFLLAQCHGKCVDLVRSRNARVARETKVSGMTASTATPVDHAVMQEHAATEVRRALALLPRAERDVIELAFYGGHTYRRVALLLGLPEGTVKARIRSALSRLHNTLCQEGMNEEYELASPA